MRGVRPRVSRACRAHATAARSQDGARRCQNVLEWTDRVARDTGTITFIAKIKTKIFIISIIYCSCCHVRHFRIVNTSRPFYYIVVHISAVLCVKIFENIVLSWIVSIFGILVYAIHSASYNRTRRNKYFIF